MTSAVCTLFEGDYHYGLGALVNSLYKHGFRGVVWAGYRGALPPWAKSVGQCAQYQEFEVLEGCRIRFVPIITEMHFTNYKPTFMLDLWKNYCPDAERLFYFDPDIVVKCRWTFFEEWASCGVALCEDLANQKMPNDHPVRVYWANFLTSGGFQLSRSLNQYFNGGFLGVHKHYEAAIYDWQNIFDHILRQGIDIRWGRPTDRTDYFQKQDQDALNLMAMTTECPLSTVGPDGMDFVEGGFLMSHAVAAPKPWDRKLIYNALRGMPPGKADKEFFNNVEHPIRLYERSHLRNIKRRLQIAAGFGRIIKRH